MGLRIPLLRAINFVSATFVIASLALIIYGISHSFDWTDEAWATSLIESSRVTEGEPWAYQYLLHPIYELLGGTSIGFRYLRFVLYFVLALASARVFLKFIDHYFRKLDNDQTWAVYIFAQVGTILAWTWMPRYFAYNELAALGIQFAVVLFVSVTVDFHTKPFKSHAGALFSIGLLLGILFYSKFTTGILGLIVFSIAFFVVFRGKLKKNYIFILFGVAFSVVCPALMGLPLGEYSSSVWANLFDEEIRTSIGHSSDLIMMYLGNLIETIYLIVIPGILLSFTLRKKFQTDLVRSYRVNRILSFSIAVEILFIVIAVLSNGFGPAGTGFFAFSLLVTAVAFFVGYGSRIFGEGFVRSKQNITPIITAVIMVAIAPFMSAFGTNNPLFWHLAFEATLWATLFAASMVTLTAIAGESKISLRLVAVSVLITTIFASYLLFMNVRNPYRAASIRLTNFYVENVNALKGIGLTAEEARWASWLSGTSTKHKLQNAETISMNSPGALLIFNNSSYASPWLDTASVASYRGLAKSCEKNQPKNLVILQPVSEMKSKSITPLRETLNKYCGLSFTNDFEIIANFDSPDSRFGMVIWKQKNATPSN